MDHRDARLALGTLPDGRVVVALTGSMRSVRGSAGSRSVHLGEMAKVMRALGRDAILLDGGVSGQLMVRGGCGAHLGGIRSACRWGCGAGPSS